MSYLVDNIANRARFSSEKMAKVNLFEGELLTVGLNCFEPGQEHKIHAHTGSDKVYCVVQGEGHFVVGDEAQTLGAGGMVFAPSGVPHGVKNAGSASLMVLVCIAPPIGKKG